MPVLTRQELYELVWSIPMTKLSERYGLSNVGLAKICKRHLVPTPPRAYWAKIASGQLLPQPRLVHVQDPTFDRVRIESRRIARLEPVRQFVIRRRAKRKASPSTLRAPGSLDGLHPAIQPTATALRRTKKSTVVAEATDPGHCGISIGVTSVERVIFILDQIARACDANGVLVSPASTHLTASIGTDAVTFEITEQIKRVPHVLTEAEIAATEKHRKRSERAGHSQQFSDWLAPKHPEFDPVRTGLLSLQVGGCGNEGVRRLWRDGKVQILENLISDIVDGLEALIFAARLEREQRARADAERKENDRRQTLAEARLRRESERRKLLDDHVLAVRRVAHLRDLIAYYNHHVVSNVESDLTRMMTWARGDLKALESSIEPVKLTEELRRRKLFPEVDELHDPLGDPPPRRLW